MELWYIARLEAEAVAAPSIFSSDHAGYRYDDPER